MSRKTRKSVAWSLWIPVILAFLLLAGAWTALILLARQHAPEPVHIRAE